MRRPSLLAPLLAAAAPLAGCGGTTTPVYGFRVVNTYPHDPTAYCQGLLFHEGKLYESTGRNGTSSVRRVNLETGKVEEVKKLPVELFGEGLALHDGLLYQLTWTSQIGNVWDPTTFELVRNFRYEGEGWGMTSDGTHLLMSDGSRYLSVRDPETFEEVRRVRVEAEGFALDKLNELEWIDGEVWANVWKQEYLARIDPETGHVLAWVDLTGLYDTSEVRDPEGVLNGIAHDPATGRLFVTGKLWPKLFEIELVKR